MSEQWKCLNCGGINPGNRETCIGCDTPRGMLPGDIVKCPNCGKVIPHHSNFCTNCKKVYRVSRKKDSDTAQKNETANFIKCFAARQSRTLILAAPDPKAERLYLMGPGDLLPRVIENENEMEDYYCLVLPGNEKGFVNKKSGIIVDLGIDEVVKEPLGYIRQNFHKPNVNITIEQPNGDMEIIGTLKADDHFPIVEERENQFKIQMPNGLQGLVHKADVVRVISPTSVPEAQPSSGLADVLIGVAGLMALGIIGGIAGDPEEKRVQRGVDKALRDRGL